MLPNLRSRRFLWSDNAILAYLALAKLLIHLLTSNGYGYFGDELYWVAMTKHLDFGYVDVPPLVAYLGALSRVLIGTSLFAIRLLPAIAGAVTVYCAGLLAREMGGGRFAQCFTALMVITAPIWLVLNSWFAYDPFDQLCTVLLLYQTAAIINRETRRKWLVLGIIAGIGLMTKLSMLFMIGAFFVAFLITARRKSFLTAGPWLAALLAALIWTPYLLWQAAHGWPLLTYWHYYALYRDHPITPLFIMELILLLNPLTFPIWLLGLFYLLFNKEGKKYRVLGLIYLILLLFFNGLMKLEPRMLVSAYFPLLAAGAIGIGRWIAAWEARRKGFNLIKPVLMGVLLMSGILLAPTSLPLLPAPALEKYMAATRALGNNVGDFRYRIPFHFAFRFGWPEMVREVAAVYHKLPEADRKKCVIWAGNYAEAGAVDLLGKEYGLPGAICSHLSYHIWGPGPLKADHGPEVAIMFGNAFSPVIFYDDATQAGLAKGSEYAVGWEQYLPIYVCRKPRANFREAWQNYKLYR